MGHVNNARYLNWVQDAVLAHWNKIAPADDVATKAWVALKHEITYRKPAFLEDDVTAQTVLERFNGARAFYSTLIKRGEEGAGRSAIELVLHRRQDPAPGTHW